MSASERVFFGRNFGREGINGYSATNLRGSTNSLLPHIDKSGSRLGHDCNQEEKKTEEQPRVVQDNDQHSLVNHLRYRLPKLV